MQRPVALVIVQFSLSQVFMMCLSKVYTNVLLLN